MNHRLSVALFLASAVLWSAAKVCALHGIQLRGGQAQDSGKYDFCPLNETAKAARHSRSRDFGKCDAKFHAKFRAQRRRGRGQCLSTGDEAALQAFVTQHTDATWLRQWPAGRAGRSGDLVTCNGDLSTCNVTLGTCNTSLSSCTRIVATVNAGTAAQADVLSGKTFSSGKRRAPTAASMTRTQA